MKLVITARNICDLISKILEAPIYTKEYKKNSRMFHGKLQ